MELYTPESRLPGASLQLTETSSRYARKISGTTALQEALKEKQQHIEQLLAERDLERAEVAKATSHICEVEKEIALLKAQHEQVGGRVGAVGSPAASSGQSCPSLTLREENSGCAKDTEMRVTNLPRPPGDFPSSGRSTFLQNLDTDLRILLFPTSYSVNRASLVAQTVKNPPAMWETGDRSQPQQDPLEKGMATHSRILASRFP